MDEEKTYELLRNLTSPIVAVTVRRGEELNGLIVNSAIRASLVPGQQRVAFYVFKRHLSHDMLAATGTFALHILARSQWSEIRELGFFSGRDRDHFEQLPHRLSEESGLPILRQAFAWMECEVVNAMDAGSSTFFMGEIDRIFRGEGQEVMDSDFFRENMPEEWQDDYVENLREVQKWAAQLEAAGMDTGYWDRLRARAREEASAG